MIEKLRRLGFAEEEGKKEQRREGEGEKWEGVHGVALVDKPAGWSSAAVVARLKRHLGAERAGHGGTLDPMATGVLLVLFGAATRLAHFGLEAEKCYAFRVVFGVGTSTGDAEGSVVARSESKVSAPMLEAVLPRFQGEIEQIPPMASAVKQGGIPLYRLWRQGIVLERAARRVEVRELKLVAFEEEQQRALFWARVSKGTYVRTLAEQIGAAVGVPAHVDFLRREAVGEWSRARALPLAEWVALSRIEARARLWPVDRLVAHLPAVVLPAKMAERFCNGAQVILREGETERGGLVRVYKEEKERFLGVGTVANGVLSPKRVVLN
ncbi:MAG: tRNA pseudouridine(55) synthase TruB [Hydrogenophilus sp.]|nr:tRNA pseudouridine(55) synthase TruB [Hydrogenophilus sp.]